MRFIRKDSGLSRQRLGRIIPREQTLTIPSEAGERREAHAFLARTPPRDPYAIWMASRETELSGQTRQEVRWVYRYKGSTADDAAQATVG